ncbi:hypothetical protein RSAG8_03010, partial [Rhizoctonia solani AG-8 WAC10335]
MTFVSSDGPVETPDMPSVDASHSGVESTGTNQVPYDCPLDLPKDKPSITILLVGETGCGKTAFMSLVLNLFKGRGPFELEDLHDKTTDSGLDRSRSQTGKAKLYTLQTPNQEFTIRILDTPGLADSRGTEQDKTNQKEINDAIKEYVTTIDAVIIMSNGTTERLAPTTDYTLKVLMTLFPRSILDNIGFIFTHVDSLSFNFQRSSLPPQLQRAQHWLIQNPLALLVKHNSLLQNNTRSARQIRQDTKTIERTYEDTIETLNEWLDWVNQRPVQPTNEINSLYEMSAKIELRIDEAISSMTLLRTLDDLRKSIGPQYIWVKEDTLEWNTICMKDTCHNNCHLNCTADGSWSSFEWTCNQFFRVRNGFQQYRVTVGGLAFLVPVPLASMMCKSCGHTLQDHKRYQSKHVQQLQRSDPTLRQNLAAAESEAAELEVAQSHVSKQLESIQKQVQQSLSRLRELIERFQAISISYNFAGYIHSTIKLLKKRREAFETEPGTQEQITLIDESIERLQQQLTILDPPPGHWVMQEHGTGANTSSRWWSDTF